METGKTKDYNCHEDWCFRTMDAKEKDITEQVIFAISSAVEAKDRYTNGHSQRVAYYAQEIAKRMGFTREQCRRVYYTGLLHDVGKISVSDAIINKPDKMKDSEYEEMKLHTTAGYFILKEISSISDFAIGARWHHERYDGKGYPNGLSGENIPLISRIVCVADAYDAMSSHRSYRKTLSQEKIKEEIQNGLGTQFDPKIGQIMLDMINEDKNFTMRQPVDDNERVILAIDDDPIVHKFLNFYFKDKSDYNLISAYSGESGINILKGTKVDLVLLDVEMPVMDGFDVLYWIRQNFRNLPVIFMTAEKDFKIIQKAESMGISDYISKPISARTLNESIKNVLHSNKQRSLINYKG